MDRLTRARIVAARKILRAVAAAIREGWTQGPFARDANGSAVDARDPRACSWCFMGAFKRVDPNPNGVDEAYWDARLAAQRVCRNGIIEWNERRGRTPEQVLAKIREASAKLPRMRHVYKALMS